MKNKRAFIFLAIVVILLLIPLVAMQFTNEVDWDIFDFVVMGFLLLGTATVCEIVLRLVKRIEYRILICGAVLLALFLIWAELAVGIFGSPFAGS